MGGGPSDFIVNCSPHLWILGFETLDFDFCLDKNVHSLVFFCDSKVTFDTEND